MKAIVAIENASAMLSQATGRLNLGLAAKRITRAGVREAAAWARQAADILDKVANLDGASPKAVQSGSSDGGLTHGRKTSGGRARS